MSYLSELIETLENALDFERRECKKFQAENETLRRRVEDEARLRSADKAYLESRDGLRHTRRFIGKDEFEKLEVSDDFHPVIYLANVPDRLNLFGDQRWTKDEEMASRALNHREFRFVRTMTFAPSSHPIAVYHEV
jgi:hypothetical protein